MEKGRVHPTPAGSQLSLPALTHMKRSSPKVQKCQAPVISIHHAAGKGQNRAGEWFLLLSSHKTLQTEREQRRLNRSTEQFLSRQRAWLPCNVWGDSSCAHPKLLDFNNPLSHVSLCLLGPETSHFKISYPSEKLGFDALH